MYEIIFMESILEPKYILNVWDNNSIRPGSQGSVGDVLAQQRLKQSAPDLAPRYDSWSSKENEVYYGSNVQNGTKESFTTTGLAARTVGRKIWRNRGFNNDIGWVHQDIVPLDRAREPRLASNPQFGWKSQQSRIFKAKVSGENFLPLPGGYGPSGAMTRGNQFPLVVQKTDGSMSYLDRQSQIEKDYKQHKLSSGPIPVYEHNVEDIQKRTAERARERANRSRYGWGV